MRENKIEAELKILNVDCAEFEIIGLDKVTEVTVIAREGDKYEV